jgi:hypothetical protein
MNNCFQPKPKAKPEVVSGDSLVKTKKQKIAKMQRLTADH